MSFPHFLFLCLLLNCAHIISIRGQGPCVFNQPECLCWPFDTYDAFDARFYTRTLESVSCTSNTSSIATFDVPPGPKYSISGKFVINKNVAEIKENHFARFSYIETLVLNNLGPEGAWQNWNDKAFGNCRISTLEILNLDGVLPPPPALIQLGNNGLKNIHIYWGKTPIRLSNYAFANFSSLNEFSFWGTSISQIDEFSFVGLEDTLTELTFTYTPLPEFPATATNRLKNLTVLGFMFNRLTDLPEKAFLPYPGLKSLTLAYNDLGNAIQSGALDDLPPKLNKLGLAGTNLKTVPKQMLINRQLMEIDFSSNFFEAIISDDFCDAINLRSLYFSYNPLSKVENGSFATLKKLGLLKSHCR